MPAVIIAACQQILEDLRLVVAQIPTATYTQPIAVMYSANIGQHTRHIIEFFQCLAQQIEHRQIDYDLRQRNLSIEQSPQVACEIITQLQHWLSSLLKTENIDCELFVNYNLQNKHDKHVVASSLHRELVYNIEHTIHHAALIKVALALLELPIDVPSHFGIAPSTVRYQQPNRASD